MTQFVVPVNILRPFHPKRVIAQYGHEWCGCVEESINWISTVLLWVNWAAVQWIGDRVNNFANFALKWRVMSSNIYQWWYLWGQTIQTFTHTIPSTNLNDRTTCNIRYKLHSRIKHRQRLYLPAGTVADTGFGIISDPREVHEPTISS